MLALAGGAGVAALAYGMLTRPFETISGYFIANSYEGGSLDVYGEEHPVVFDPRLRDAVSSFISRSFWKRLLSSSKR